MALKTITKVGDITNLSDARYCAGMGVDYLGFNFDKKNAIPLENFIAIRQWVEGIKVIGEFQDTDDQTIQNIFNDQKLDAVQTSSIESAIKLCNKNIPTILSIDVDSFEISELNSLKDKLEFLVLESKEDKQIDIEKINLLGTKFKILIGYNIQAENINETINHINISGIALKGSEEIRPGFKNFDELADILEELEVIDY